MNEFQEEIYNEAFADELQKIAGERGDRAAKGGRIGVGIGGSLGALAYGTSGAKMRNSQRKNFDKLPAFLKKQMKRPSKASVIGAALGLGALGILSGGVTGGLIGAGTGAIMPNKEK